MKYFLFLIILAFTGCEATPRPEPIDNGWVVEETSAAISIEGHSLALMFSAEDAWTLEHFSFHGHPLVINTGYNGCVYRQLDGEWIGTGHGGEVVQSIDVIQNKADITFEKRSTLGAIEHRAVWNIHQDGWILVTHEWNIPPELSEPHAFYGFMFCHPNELTASEDVDDGDAQFHDLPQPTIMSSDSYSVRYVITEGIPKRIMLWDREEDNKLYISPRICAGACSMALEIRPWEEARP